MDRQPSHLLLIDSPSGSGFLFGSLVPVGHVAKHLGVSSRRVRFLLNAGRLLGRKLENGYWEVVYPYQFTVGQRGPAIQSKVLRKSA